LTLARGNYSLFEIGSFFRTGLLAFLLLNFLTSANAQVLYGTLTSSVLDPSGAAVTGATVAVRNQGIGASVEARTDDTGAFTFGNLPPGTDDFKVVANGFRTQSETGVTISVNTVRR